MQLAKPCLDIGLFTTNKDAMLAFYRDAVGLPYEELLAVGGGVQQHRHTLNGSVLKLNHSRDALESTGASGYRALHIARPGLRAAQLLQDPDGNRIRLVPHGTDDITAIQVDVQVHDLAAHRRFWGDWFGAEKLSGDRFRVGTTLIALEGGAPASRVSEAEREREGESADTPSTAGNATAGMRGIGFRYLTVQVFDVVAEHQAIIAAGAWEGRPPNVLGDVARISFVRDPDGNWIEISQRRSLTGSLA